MLGQKSLANTRCENTPHILPVRGCLEEVGRLMRGDFYIGRGSRQRSPKRSTFANDFKVSEFGREIAISKFHESETYPHVWNDSTSLNIDDPPRTCASEDSPASVPASASHDCDGFTLQGKGTATCAESFGAKSSATALTTQVCHFYGCT